MEVLNAYQSISKSGILQTNFLSPRKNPVLDRVLHEKLRENLKTSFQNHLNKEKSTVDLQDLPVEATGDEEREHAAKDLAALLRVHISGVPLVITFTCSWLDPVNELCSQVVGMFHCRDCLTFWKKAGRTPLICNEKSAYIIGSTVRLTITEATALVDILHCSIKHSSSMFEEMFPLLRNAKCSAEKNRVLDSILVAESSFHGLGKNHETIVFAGGVLGPDGLLYPYGTYRDEDMFFKGGPSLKLNCRIMKYKNDATNLAQAEEDFLLAFDGQSYAKTLRKINRYIRISAAEAEEANFLESLSKEMKDSDFGDVMFSRREFNSTYKNFFRRKDIGDNEAYRYFVPEQDLTQLSHELDKQKQLMSKIQLINERCRRHSMLDSKAMECNRIYNTKTEERVRSPTVAYVQDKSDQALPTRLSTPAFKAHFPPKQSSGSLPRTAGVKIYYPIHTKLLHFIKRPETTEYTAQSQYTTFTNLTRQQTSQSNKCTSQPKQQLNQSVPGSRPVVQLPRQGQQKVLNPAVKNRTGRPPPHKRARLKSIIGNIGNSGGATDAITSVSNGNYYDILKRRPKSQFLHRLQSTISIKSVRSKAESSEITSSTTSMESDISSMSLHFTDGEDEGEEEEKEEEAEENTSSEEENSISENKNNIMNDTTVARIYEDFRDDIANRFRPFRRRISLTVEKLGRSATILPETSLSAEAIINADEIKDHQPETESESSETTTDSAEDRRLQMLRNFIEDRRWSIPSDHFSLNFTKNYSFSYFSLPKHVKKRNEELSSGSFKLPKITLNVAEKQKTPKTVAQLYPSKYRLVNPLLSNSHLFK